MRILSKDLDPEYAEPVYVPLDALQLGCDKWFELHSDSELDSPWIECSEAGTWMLSSIQCKIKLNVFFPTRKNYIYRCQGSWSTTPGLNSRTKVLKCDKGRHSFETGGTGGAPW